MGDRVEALRKSRNKTRSISTDSFKRALSDPNLLDGLDQLPEEEGESPRNGGITPEPPQVIVVPAEKKFLSLRVKSSSKMTVIKKFSLDNSPRSTFFVPEEEAFDEAPRRRSKSFEPPSERTEESGDTSSQDSHDTAL